MAVSLASTVIVLRSLKPAAKVGALTAAGRVSKNAMKRLQLYPPHIVVLLADDLGFNDVGFSWKPGGLHGRIATPRVDSLAARPGTVLLSNLYSMPFCTPTRSALMTGVHPTKIGMHHFVLLSSQPTGLPLDLPPLLPAQLKANFGYRTHCVGKWHLGYAKFDYFPTHRGFDSFFGYMGGAQDYWTHDNAEWLSGRMQRPHKPAKGALGHDYFRGTVPVPRSQVDGVHGSTLIAREATHVIARHAELVREARQAAETAAAAAAAATGTGVASEERAGGCDRGFEPPLFLYVASQAPHLHFHGAPGDMYARVDAQASSSPEGSEAGAASGGSGSTGSSSDGSGSSSDGSGSSSGREAGGREAEEKLRADGRREVAALVSCVDVLVGEVEDALRVGGLWEDTLLLFASDNGPEAGVMPGPSSFPFRGKKRTLWEGGVKSVAFLHSPTVLLGHSSPAAPHPRNPVAPASSQGRRERASRTFSGLVHFADLFPTLMDAAASRTVKATTDDHREGSVGGAGGLWSSSDGVSFWDALVTGKSESRRSEMLLQYDQVGNCGALRRGNFKLVWNGDCGYNAAVFGGWEVPPAPPESLAGADGAVESGSDLCGGAAEAGGAHSTQTTGWELFDLSADPFETTNVWAQHLEDGLALGMKEALEAHGRRTAPALSWETPGDPAASPDLHDGLWVPWLEPEFAPSDPAAGD